MGKSLKELADELKKVNDDYHEVIDEILELKDLDVVNKAVIGSKARRIFGYMDDLNRYLEIVIG